MKMWVVRSLLCAVIGLFVLLVRSCLNLHLESNQQLEAFKNWLLDWVDKQERRFSAWRELRAGSPARIRQFMLSTGNFTVRQFLAATEADYCPGLQYIIVTLPVPFTLWAARGAIGIGGNRLDGRLLIDSHLSSGVHEVIIATDLEAKTAFEFFFNKPSHGVEVRRQHRVPNAKLAVPLWLSRKSRQQLEAHQASPPSGPANVVPLHAVQ